VASETRPAFAVWITGLPASGKSTVTAALVRLLRGCGIDVAVLESDMLRKQFSGPEEYGERDREYFYGSMAFIGRVLTDHGVPVIFDATANRRSYRDRARQQIPRFIEVFIDCPLETCMQRDPKGIYRKARQGQAANVPGVQSVYEPPENPDVIIQSGRDSPDEAAKQILEKLRHGEFW
jgi:adenylylsulfate kinase